MKSLKKKDVDMFRKKLSNVDIHPVASHMPYLPNLSSPNAAVYRHSVKTLVAELERSGKLGLDYVVTHLGSHMGSGYESGLKRIVAAFNQALSSVDNNVLLLLENTAGQKNSMGHSFEDIGRIMGQIEDRSRIGLCFDTSHGFAAGYELRTPQKLDLTLKDLDKAIGLDRLRMIHLNDSQGELGSHLDRHEHIGIGKIGTEGFKTILHNEIIRSVPLILETPIDDRRNDVENLTQVRQLAV